MQIVSLCRARSCLKRATLNAEKVDSAGRHVRQIELCERHARVVIARERARSLEIQDRLRLATACWKDRGPETGQDLGGGSSLSGLYGIVAIGDSKRKFRIKTDWR